MIKQQGFYFLYSSGQVNNVSGIFEARSSDAATWNLGTTPILRHGANGTWDSGAIYSPNVLWNGTMYLMYFVGVNGSIYSRSIGLAFSADNVNWREYAHNPVLKGGPDYYDGAYVRFPSVLLDGKTYKMWYTGTAPTNYSQTPSFFEAIDYATSPDGLHWTKYPGNPIFGNTTTWGSSTNFVFFHHPSVVKINATYLMAGDDSYQISYASSRDGANWTAAKPPLLAPPKGPAWNNGSATAPSITQNGSQVLLFYSGDSLVTKPTYSEMLPLGIGLASCHFLFVTTTNTATVTSTTTVTSTRTAIATSTTTAVQTQTVTSVTTTSSTETLVGVPNAFLEIATTGAVVLGASALALLLIRTASRRH